MITGRTIKENGCANGWISIVRHDRFERLCFVKRI